MIPIIFRGEICFPGIPTCTTSFNITPILVCKFAPMIASESPSPRFFRVPPATILTFIAIVIGTAGYIAFSGIMFGFREYIIEQLVNNDAQIRISPRDELISEDMFNNIFFSDSTIKWIKPPSGKTDNSRLDNIQWWYEKLQKDPEIVAYSPQLVRQITFLRGKLLFPAKVIGVRPETQALITNTDK